MRDEHLSVKRNWLLVIDDCLPFTSYHSPVTIHQLPFSSYHSAAGSLCVLRDFFELFFDAGQPGADLQ